jgi:hypothetical protein
VENIDMETPLPLHYRDEFYPSGFRKILAIMLVTAVTVLPEFFSWASPPRQEVSFGSPGARFPSSRFSSDRFQEDSGGSTAGKVLGVVWRIFKTGFVMVVATLGVMLYYPRPGFKRYALLCGPLIAIMVPLTLSLYLRGRTEIFRAEILVVSLVAAIPAIALYFYLTWRKAQRLGMEW